MILLTYIYFIISKEKKKYFFFVTSFLRFVYDLFLGKSIFCMKFQINISIFKYPSLTGKCIPYSKYKIRFPLDTRFSCNKSV